MNPAVFVDRDNTLIHNDGDLGDPDQVRLIQGAASAIASLCGLGYRVVVVTNQGGVARGKYTEADVEAVHQRIRELVTQAANGARIERFYFCPFHPEGTVPEYAREHPNRKPAPGMLQQAAKELNLDLSQSWMVGDQMRDIHAGIAAGTRTILVRPDVDTLTLHDFREPHLSAGDDEAPSQEVTPGFLARSMVEAVRIIAQQRKPDSHEDTKRSTSKRWDAAAVAQVQQQMTPQAKPAAIKNAKTTDAVSSAPAPAVTKPAKPFRPVGAPEPFEPKESSPQPSAATKAPERDKSNTKKPAPPKAEQKQIAAPEASPTPPVETDERTLRLILQELRHQRGQGTDFSHLKIVAILLQLVAGVFLLVGLWMGSQDISMFLRWLGAALIVQMLTIAILLFDQR